MKPSLRITVTLIAFFFCHLAATPVETIGALSVSNNQVVGANGNAAQLRGMSFFWNIAQEAGGYWNANVVDWLADDWHANLVRASMAVEDSWGTDNTLTSGAYKGYLYDPAWNQAMVETVVDAAIAKGIYVIIDWHSHWTNDNSNGKQDSAVNFFTRMAQKYASYPNVIYEIYNEPGTDDWSVIKAYAEKIIPIIRTYDPDNLIIVGAPNYAAEVLKPAADPLTGSNAFNVAYGFHFYASEEWHYNNYMTNANTALQSIPLFVSEWGLSPASGDGTINTAWLATFFSWMEGKKLSWAAWSICNKNETSASLYTTASTVGNWADTDLRQAGTYLRTQLRALNPEWSSSNAIKTSKQGFSISLSNPTPNTIQAVFPKGAYTQATLTNVNGEKIAQKSISNTSTSVDLTVPHFSGVAILTLKGKVGKVQKSVIMQ